MMVDAMVASTVDQKVHVMDALWVDVKVAHLVDWKALCLVALL